jgi:hypothetical protein
MASTVTNASTVFSVAVETGKDTCSMCQKTVYPMEKLSADDKVGKSKLGFPQGVLEMCTLQKNIATRKLCCIEWSILLQTSF